jgi:hypothetical protein
LCFFELKFLSLKKNFNYNKEKYSSIDKFGNYSSIQANSLIIVEIIFKLKKSCKKYDNDPYMHLMFAIRFLQGKCNLHKRREEKKRRKKTHK